ncbi:MAG TPA: hypothetical protein VGX94_04750 [Terriglobia bacterium]|nr:hypothetical protein [Terriglobia bacterium]
MQIASFYQHRIRILVNLGIILAITLPAFAYLPRPCVGGTLPVATFKLLIVPSLGGTPLPVKDVNIVRAGDRLKYEPIMVPSPIRNQARVAIVLAPAVKAKDKGIEVLDAQPAKDAAEWTIPFRASVVGVVFGPRGLSVKKVHSLVQSDPELVPELATYAEQTAEVNALVQTLSQYDQSKPGSEDLNAALGGFSAEYGVALPRLTSGTPTDQQASMLLQAVMPSVSNYDPLTSARSAMVAQSAGLAASVAALFYGTPVGLAAGGAAFFVNMRTMMFPGTDFRSAFSQPAIPNGMEFCSKDQKPVPRTRLAYLWMLKVPDADAPTASLAKTETLPMGSKSDLKITGATNEQLRLLPRARGWRLVSGAQSVDVPGKITVGTEHDTLALDLTHAKLSAGDYQLAALWDWEPMKVEGSVRLRPYSDFSGVKLTPDSADALRAKNGVVNLNLVGADFEFVSKATLETDDNASSAKPLSFTLPAGADAGEQLQMDVKVATDGLTPGKHRILLTQTDGKTQAVPVVVHPPNSEIADAPYAANLGESSQVIIIHGTSLERIEGLAGDNAAWELAPVPEGSHGLTERSVTIKLHAGLSAGQTLSPNMTIEGIGQPTLIPGLVRVAPPRPKIMSVTDSFPTADNVALRTGEIPAGEAVSFSLHTENATAPSLDVACANTTDERMALDLKPGGPLGQNSLAQLDDAGDGILFLSLDPGTVGQSGCQLTAVVTTSDAGASDPVTLGRVIRLPHIGKFSLSSDALGRSLYAGTLTGQDLQMIEKTGWNAAMGYPVQGIPTPVPGSNIKQTLKIELPWPPPSPGAPVYIWLRGENQGRRTNASY